MIKVIAVSDPASDYSSTLVTPLSYKEFSNYTELRVALLKAHPSASRAPLNALVVEDNKQLTNLYYAPHSIEPMLVLCASPMLGEALRLLVATHKEQEALCRLIGSLASRCGPDRLALKEGGDHEK